MLYDDFKPIVDLLLNNWTALQLAVEHGMGAPGGKQTAQLMSVYITRYCVENVVDRDDLAEVLEDLMDEEFDTACHDNSPKEVAGLLVDFLALLKEGRHTELRSLIEAMPKCQLWLSQPIQKSAPPQSHGNPDDDTTSSGTDDDDDNSSPMNGHHQVPSQFGESTSSTQESEPMDEDPEAEPGWTTVRTRRKK